MLFARLIQQETLQDIASLHPGGAASHPEQKNVGLSLVSNCKGHQISSGVLPGLAGPNLEA